MKTIRNYRLLAAVLLFAPLVTCDSRGGESGAPSSESEAPFTFGVVADCQYADKPARGARHYREALYKLQECVADFNKRRPAFVVDLGDIVDGRPGIENSRADLDRVLAVYGRLDMPLYHVVGNHCLTVGREHLLENLNLERSYYEFSFPGASGWRFLVVDGMDAGYGVVGDEQLEWLRARLREAERRNERVLVFCHFAVLAESAPRHRMNEPDPLLAMLAESTAVAAWFAGHDHQGGYGARHGVHHVTFRGMVESPQNNAYALVELHADRIRIIGFGDEESRELPLPAP